MNLIKVMTIFGTRPEAVKMAPLVNELKKCPQIETKVCVTAQHRDMLDQVLELFNIKPDYDMNIMKNRQSLTGVTSRVLEGLEEMFSEYKPDIVLVHGDTTTTLAASLAAFYQKIKVAHVEAGLRSFDKYSPYPEEMNRKLTTAIADMYFAPTNFNKDNLLNEGINKELIYITGNTGIDAMSTTVESDYKFECEELNNIDYKNKKVIFVTAHRRENWGEGLENICKALKCLAENNEAMEIVYLVHLNPVVRDTAEKYLSGVERVHLIPAQGVKESHNLINLSYMLMTDSGGIQEEAPHLGKPVLVFRDVTERQEAVEAGTIKLVGTDIDTIVKSAEELLNNNELYKKMKDAPNPYGDGTASKRIVEGILYYFGFSDNRPEDFLV